MASEIIKKETEIPNSRIAKDTNNETISHFLTTNGVVFSKQTDAKKCQKNVDLIENFRSIFSESKNNLKQGNIGLATVISNTNNTRGSKNIVDYFWIKYKDKEELSFLSKFCYIYYNTTYKYPTSADVDKWSNKWLFLVIYRSDSGGIDLGGWDIDYLKETIQILSNSFPGQVSKNINNYSSLIDLED